MTSDREKPDAKPAPSHETDALLVSVVIPTFNSEGTIRRAIRSVLDQGYPALEVIVADDASHDGTRDAVLSLGDARVTFVDSPEATNTGPARTRNRALAKVTGRYIAFLDSDDEWLPGKLEKQVRYLEENPDCSIVVTNADDITPEGEVLCTEFGSSPPTDGEDAWRKLLKRSFIETSSVMTRAELVHDLGGFNPDLFVSQDQDLWIRLALRGKVGIIDEVFGRIHIVPTGHMTRNANRQADIMLPMIERHVANAGARLSDAERDDILGYRYEAVGRALFLAGAYMAGIRLLTRASRRSGRWLSNGFFVCHANPAGIRMKRMLNRFL